MACNNLSLHKCLKNSLPSPCRTPSSSSISSHKLSVSQSLRCSVRTATGLSASPPSTNAAFTWDDVLRIARSEDDPSVLSGFFEKISVCNRNLENQREFVPFVVEDQIVGYIHIRFADNLRRFKDVFLFPQDRSYNAHFGWHVTLHRTLESPEDKTSAVGHVIRCLGEEVIPGIRNELYPVVSSFGTQVFFSLERAAAPYFGIKAYGVHMNGYVEKDGQKSLWIGKRSQEKATYPGMLDHLVAGGLS